jgi:hypothetical protein
MVVDSEGSVLEEVSQVRLLGSRLGGKRNGPSSCNKRDIFIFQPLAEISSSPMYPSRLVRTFSTDGKI